ncbi:MAG: ABC transporter permease [Armatimonadetes bacterium]|nr:ABC transporter permease [Armatimonadota bacterium]
MPVAGRPADAGHGGGAARAGVSRVPRRLPRPIRRLLRDRVAVIAGIVMLVALAVALLAPVIVPHDPFAPEPMVRLQSPSATHWFGTDELGRDVFSRVLFGARISLQIALITVSLAVVVGSTFGLIAGYFGAWVDQLIMRVTDIFLAFPGLVLAMALSAALGPSVQHIAVALGLVWWPGYARLMRGQVLSVRSQLYVEASRAVGGSAARILVRHVLINAFDPVAVRATMTSGYAILSGAALSFIGLGAQPPMPEWGVMVAGARFYILDAWWYPTLVGAAIFVTILAITVFGDGLQDAVDPRLVQPGMSGH